MPFQVFDYRKDIRNLLTTPQMRCRFLKMEVGQYNQGHTHDLGHEFFLILQGQAEFEIEGHKEVVGPGQICIALTDEMHAVRNVGDDEVIMFLAVTPHIHPTHTFWTEDGEKEPPRFSPNTAYDLPLDRTSSTEKLADDHLKAAEQLEKTVITTTQIQRDQMAAFKQAIVDGNKDDALQARDAMWDSLYTMFRDMHDLAGIWNEFTSRTADDEQFDQNFV